MNLTVEQALQHAVEAHRANRFDEAERFYRAILSAQPDHSEANHNLGVLAVTLGQASAGLPFLKSALERDPSQGQFWLSLADALLISGQAEEAARLLAQGRAVGLSGEGVDALERRIAASPGGGAAKTPAAETQDGAPPRAMLESLVADYSAGDLARAESRAEDLTRAFPAHPFAWKILGAIRQSQNRFAEAFALKERAVALDPDDAAAHANLAVTLNHLGRYAEAEACCLDALRRDPNLAEARHTLGLALKALGRSAEAEAAFRTTIALKPDHAKAHNSLGAVLYSAGRLSDAEASYRTAVALQPQLAEAHNNLGVALYGLGQLVEAEASYRQAIALQPDFAEAHNNLGVTLNDMGRLSQAIDSYREAIRLKRDSGAHSNLAGTLTDLGRVAEARLLHDQAVQLSPHYAEAHSNLLFGLNYIESLPPAEALAEAKSYGAKVSATAVPKFSSWRIDRQSERLRIGFVSGDLRNHPVGYFLEGLVRHLDPDRFELIAFSTQRREDALTDRIRPVFKSWRALSGLDDAQAARTIHDEGVHLLIDLSGHTAHNRLPVFAYRPAPVQASWLGYFATTGLPEMDYFLGDPQMAPAEEEGHFSERVWRMPETWFCLTPPEPEVPIVGRSAQGRSGVTFGCFGNFAKLNDAVIDAWAAILRRVPDASLVLKANPFADPEVVALVRGWFDARGVAPERLSLEGYTSRAAYFESYNRIDIVLDTFPYPGGTTSVEALWMGVPVLTRRGDRFLSHLGESVVTNAGLSRWIAADATDYVEKAIAFASDLESRAPDKQDLRRRVLQSPLFDAPRFARGFGEALWGMWREKIADLSAPSLR